MFFKKKIDWSKYTKKEEPIPEPPKAEPERSYPYDALFSRKSKLLTNRDYGLNVKVTGPGEDDVKLSLESMQVALLMDIRDKLDAITDRMDTLVTALNSNIEDAKVEPTETLKKYLDFLEGIC